MNFGKSSPDIFSYKYTNQIKQERETEERTKKKNRREKQRKIEKYKGKEHRAGDEVGSRAWPNEHRWSFIPQGLCSKRGDRLGRTFPVSLPSLGSYWGSLGAKANAWDWM